MSNWRDSLVALQDQLEAFEKSLYLRDAELKLLREIDSALINTPADLNNIFEKIMSGALHFTTGASGQLLIPRGRKLRIVWTSGKPSEIGESVDINDSVTGKAYLRKRAYNVKDVRTLKLYKGYLDNMLSELAVPLMDNKIPIGVINLESPLAAAFKRHHIEMVNTLAGQATIAIKIVNSVEQLNFLLRAMGSSTSSDDPVTNALYAITDKARDITGADGCQLLLVDRDELVIKFSTDQDDIDRRVSIFDSISGRGVQAKHAIILDDVQKDKKYKAILCDMHSELAVPIIVSDEVIGVINAESKEQTAFYPHDAYMLQHFANQAGILLTALRRSENLANAQHVIGSMWAMAAVGDRAGNLLHRFKNPISGIGSIIVEIREKCTEELKNDFLRKRLDEIYDASNELIESVDEFRRDIGGRLPDEEELIEISPIEQINFVLKSIRIPSNIQLNKQFRRNIPNITTLQGFGDIIYNLVRNSLDASKAGGDITITVEPFYSRLQKRLEGICIIVEDTGQGMSSEELKEIFDFRSSKELDEKTGFGLWWTKRFLERVGGEIYPDYTYAKGTKITVFHPLRAKSSAE